MWAEGECQTKENESDRVARRSSTQRTLWPVSSEMTPGAAAITPAVWTPVSDELMPARRSVQQRNTLFFQNQCELFSNWFIFYLFNQGLGIDILSLALGLLVKQGV